MPLLASLLAAAFSSVLGVFAIYVTRKVAFALAAVATMTALTAALYVTMRGLMTTLNSEMVGMSAVWTMFLGIGVPPVAPLCWSTYATIWATCTVYAWQKDLLRITVAV